jgi:hypothetical protein
LKTGGWQSESHLEKQGVGAKALAVSASKCCPGRLGALMVECQIGAEAGAWGERGWWRRSGAQSQVAGAGAAADSVFSQREGRVSCSTGAVGWCLRRVRVSEAARRASNSHRFGWCGSLVTRLVARFAVVVGRGVGACRSELVVAAAALGFGVSRLVARVGRGGGVVVWASGPGANTALKLTWLSGSGKRRIARIR